MKDFQNVQNLYSALKANRERNKPLWDIISHYTGIGVNPDYLWSNNQTNKSNPLDDFIDDPSSAIAVNQQADYMIGIMWGTGDRVFDVVPSRYVADLIDPQAVKDYYSFVTEQTLYHMNHAQAGFHTALRPYAYDQAAFGTSGIGVFPNKGFANKVDDNALVFRSYGVDNMCIDEGKSGQVEFIFPVYHWRTNRIVNEFCKKGGVIDDASIAKLPKRIQDAYTSGDFNQEFNIVFGVFPREDFNPKMKGAKGARYRGVWFLDDATQNNIFFEEDFVERPISVCRQIKIRGDVYGRSSGTMLISSIRSVNFMIGNTIQIMEKMANPSLGVFNNSIFGDGVLDTSAGELAVFNSTFAQGQPPIFPLHDVGDPSGIIKFIVPYLNEKINTAFKIDTLLDFSSTSQMTATESLQRYNIRGKALSGMLQQQKIEMLEPTVRRSVSILYNLGQLGVNPQSPEAKRFQDRGLDNRIIPAEVLQVIKSGRPWYELRFNNELERLTRTQAIQDLSQMLQVVTAMAQINPQVLEAIDWYQFLSNMNELLDVNSKIMLSAVDFKKAIKAQAQAQAAANALQAGQGAANIQNTVAQANRNNKAATNGSGQ